MSAELDKHLRADTPHARADHAVKLRAWFASLAGRNSSPVDILFGPGHSITEGSGATTKADRWQDLVRDALRSRYQPSGVAGGAGYIPAFTYYNNPVTYSGSYTQPSTNGLGFLGITMSPAATATPSFTGTALDVFVTKVSGGGTLTVSVDGASSGNGICVHQYGNRFASERGCDACRRAVGWRSHGRGYRFFGHVDP